MVSYDFLRVVVSVLVCAYACRGYSCILMHVCISLSQFINAVRCISGGEFVGVS